MREGPCIFEAICRKALATRGAAVTIRSKALGLTGHRARALLTFLHELGCQGRRASRATKMICPKEVIDKLCRGFYQFYIKLRDLGLY
jgi:hypothetical protein